MNYKIIMIFFAVILFSQSVTMSNTFAQTQINALAKGGILVNDNVCSDEIFEINIHWKLENYYDNRGFKIEYSATHASGLVLVKIALFDPSTTNGHTDTFITDIPGQWTFEIISIQHTTSYSAFPIDYDGVDSKIYITIPPCDNPLEFVENNPNNIAINSEIPSWIKQAGDFWVQGQTSDREFASSIAYLVRSDIIPVDDVELDTDGKIVIDENMQMPEWIKNNIKWWVTGAISDTEFQSGVKFMLDEKIIDFRERAPVGSIMDEGIGYVNPNLGKYIEESEDFIISSKTGVWHDSTQFFGCGNGVLEAFWFMENNNLPDYATVRMTSPFGDVQFLSVGLSSENVYEFKREMSISGTWKLEIIDKDFLQEDEFDQDQHDARIYETSAVFVTVPPIDCGPLELESLDETEPTPEPISSDDPNPDHSILDEMEDSDTIVVTNIYVNCIDETEVEITWTLQSDDSDLGLKNHSSDAKITDDSGGNFDTGGIEFPTGNKISQKYFLNENTYYFELQSIKPTEQPIIHLVSGGGVSVSVPCELSVLDEGIGYEESEENQEGTNVTPVSSDNIIVTNKWFDQPTYLNGEIAGAWANWQFEYGDGTKPVRMTVLVTLNGGAERPAWEWASNDGLLRLFLSNGDSVSIVDYGEGLYVGHGDSLTFNP